MKKFLVVGNPIYLPLHESDSLNFAVMRVLTLLSRRGTEEFTVTNKGAEYRFMVQGVLIYRVVKSRRFKEESRQAAGSEE